MELDSELEESIKNLIDKCDGDVEKAQSIVTQKGIKGILEPRTHAAQVRRAGDVIDLVDVFDQYLEKHHPDILVKHNENRKR